MPCLSAPLGTTDRHKGKREGKGGANIQKQQSNIQRHWQGEGEKDGKVEGGGTFWIHSRAIAMVTAEKRLEGLVLCRPVLERRLRGVGLGTVQRRFGSWMDEQGREVGVSLVTTRREETVSGGVRQQQLEHVRYCSRGLWPAALPPSGPHPGYAHRLPQPVAARSWAIS